MSYILEQIHNRKTKKTECCGDKEKLESTVTLKFNLGLIHDLDTPKQEVFKNLINIVENELNREIKKFKEELEK